MKKYRARSPLVQYSSPICGDSSVVQFNASTKVTKYLWAHKSSGYFAQILEAAHVDGVGYWMCTSEHHHACMHGSQKWVAKLCGSRVPTVPTHVRHACQPTRADPLISRTNPRVRKVLSNSIPIENTYYKENNGVKPRGQY